MMNRRPFLCGLTLGMLSTPLAAEAQPAVRVARIGVLWFTFPPVSAPFFEALRDGLRELGYIEGQNIAFEQRWAETDPRRYPELAAELVCLKVDVIVAGNLESARAAKDATATIPIVLTAGGDPIRANELRKEPKGYAASRTGTGPRPVAPGLRPQRFVAICYHSAAKPPRNGGIRGPPASTPVRRVSAGLDRARFAQGGRRTPIGRPAEADGREPVGAVTVGQAAERAVRI